MVVLALDYGEKKVGLAVTPNGRVVLPLGTIVYQDQDELISLLRATCQDYQVSEIVVGLPLTRGGATRGTALRVQAFGQRLGRRLGLPVKFSNERLTTYAAQAEGKKLRQLGMKQTAAEDSLAARLILQDYLEGLGSKT